jgi:hypothetical protein
LNGDQQRNKSEIAGKAFGHRIHFLACCG